MRYFSFILIFLCSINIFSQQYDTIHHYKLNIWKDGKIINTNAITPDLKISFVEKDIDTLIVTTFASIYSHMTGGYYGYINREGYWGIQEITTDEVVVPTRGFDWFDNGIHIDMHQHTWNEYTITINNSWSFIYEGIKKCNETIDCITNKYRNNQTTYPDSISSIIAEIKVMRAFYHYLAIDLYGNALIYENTTSKRQYSRKYIYNWIESEILNNIDMLPNLVNYGRITRPVAYMILAKLYLNAEIYTGTAQWQKCINYCDSIIEGEYGYVLSEDYFDTFKKENGVCEWENINTWYTNENLFKANNDKCNKEIIFPIIFDSEYAKGNIFHLLTLHYVHEQVYDFTTQPWNGPCTLGSFYDKYTDNDLRKAQWLVGPIMKDGEIMKYSNMYLTNTNAIITDTVTTIEDDKAANTFEGPRFVKFEIEPGIDAFANSDFPIYRYADVLLMKAECLMRLNYGYATEEALALINKVHTRAGLNPYTTITLDELLDERGRELAWEGHRRQDLIRFDKFANGIWEFKPQTSKNREIFPIPGYVIEENPEYIQNSWK